MTPEWQTSSWRTRPIAQQPTYQDIGLEKEILSKISNLPPLVAPGEVISLRQKIADARCGKRFILQGGDCAERFQDCRPDSIVNKLKIILQMSVILSYGAKRPVIRIGRIAGQYAKPRSTAMETINGSEIPSYKGDIINSFEADPKSREPDPKRLLQSYQHASMTLNYIRALIVGGFADLHYPQHWNLSGFVNEEQRERYGDMVSSIQDAIGFMEAVGGAKEETLGSIDFYTSHEGLLLGFEEALTRKENGQYYNLGAHMLWIGDRTRQLDGAHVEYFRGIANPIGVKVGPKIDPDELVQLIRTLNQANIPGKVTLITRLGAQDIEKKLPPLLKAVRKDKAEVSWSCDPMHGNTIKTKSGIKTRKIEDILSELQATFRIHHSHGSFLGGVHFEMTGENVTECIGGSEGLTDQDLGRNYETFCDPRLNYSQSLELAFLISSFLKKEGHLTS